MARSTHQRVIEDRLKELHQKRRLIASSHISRMEATQRSYEAQIGCSKTSTR